MAFLAFEDDNEEQAVEPSLDHLISQNFVHLTCESDISICKEDEHRFEVVIGWRLLVVVKVGILMV